MDPSKRVLLPQDVSPQVYHLDLDVFLETHSFDGNLAIDVTVNKPEVTSVTLHSKELSIEQASFVGADAGAEIKAEEINFNLKLTTVAVVFGSALPVGGGQLRLKFRGCLNDQMAGFYRSKYTALNGEKRIMASTQFEALDARRCFPCWDEPAAKAQFDVTLTVPSDRQAFSNMPETRSVELPGGRRRITFERTPKMSTYLLAFCVGEFDFVQGRTEHGVTIRCYTPPGKSETGEFSLEVALRCLDLYDDYFGVAYPLPKLDMVAIPEFAAGAMENWGLVTYREVDLLIDAAASATQRQRVCTVVTHELAHQWFGNLVTMTWWDDLWLNEGFACWMQTYAADKLFPEWNMWEQFVQDDQQAALRLDGLRSSHPIQVPIAHAEEVEQVFDAISYCKGGSVIRMATAMLGADAWRDGLRIYMKRHAYGNTETSDLWAAMSEASGKDVAALMSSWTEQMGFPVVDVSAEGCSPGELKFKQSWFLADGSSPTDSEQASRKNWSIPLNLISDGATGAAELFLTESEAKLPCGGSFVKVNGGQSGLYRVSYSDDLLAALLKQVALGDGGPLRAEDRAALINDGSALAKTGARGVDGLARILDACREDSSMIVWQAIGEALNGLDKVLINASDGAVHAEFKAWAGRLVGPLAARLGWDEREDDDHLTKQLRGIAVGLSGKYAPSDSVVAEARRRFAALVAEPANKAILPADFKVSVFKIVLRAGGAAEYEQALSLFAAAESNVEKKHVMHALGATGVQELKQRTLEWALRSEDVKLQDFFYPLLSVSSSSKQGLQASWQFYQDNFDEFKAKLASAHPALMDAAIVYSCGGFATAARADEIDAFFKAHPLPSNQRKLSQMLEGMRTNALFLDRIESAGTITADFFKQLA